MAISGLYLHEGGPNYEGKFRQQRKAQLRKKEK